MAQTAWRRLKEWEAQGVWEKLWRRLLDWGYREKKLSLEGVGVDATTGEAKKGGKRWASTATVGGRGRRSTRS
ncbi:MAG: hypothetical protein V2G41_10250 [bacterium JZ-2024 1]